MTTFEPQKQEPDAWKRWAHYALVLQSRHKFMLLVLALVVTGVFGLMFWILNWRINMVLMLFSAPLMLSVFISVFFWLDRTALPDWTPSRIPALIGKTVMAGLLGWLVFIVVISVFFLIGYLVYILSSGESQVINQASREFSEHAPGNLYLFFSVLVFTLLPLAAYFAQGLAPLVSIWFVLPLLHFMSIGIVDAYRLSYRAEKLNWSAVNASILFSLSLLSLVLISGGILVFVVLPYLGAMQYASFRDVFLQKIDMHEQAENQQTNIQTEPRHL